MPCPHPKILFQLPTPSSCASVWGSRGRKHKGKLQVKMSFFSPVSSAWCLALWCSWLFSWATWSKTSHFMGFKLPHIGKLRRNPQPNALWHMRAYHSEWNCNTNCEVETTQRPTRKTQFQRSATQVTWITVSWSNPTSSVTPLWCSKWNIAWTRHQQRSEFSFLVSIKSTDHCWLAGWWFGYACSRHTPGGRDPLQECNKVPRVGTTTKLEKGQELTIQT